MSAKGKKEIMNAKRWKSADDVPSEAINMAEEMCSLPTFTSSSLPFFPENIEDDAQVYPIDALEFSNEGLVEDLWLQDVDSFLQQQQEPEFSKASFF